MPQGLAVYQDGVRVNEPFGDTVNWDALPTNAVAGVVLMPGSNPLFGLNALGGALSLQTKTGFSHAGHAARVSAGSFGRQWAELESGGRLGGSVAYFAAARWLQEDGWRDYSPSRVTQVFGNLSWQSDRSRRRGDRDRQHQSADRQRAGARCSCCSRIAARCSRTPTRRRPTSGCSR